MQTHLFSIFGSLRRTNRIDLHVTSLTTKIRVRMYLLLPLKRKVQL